MALTLPPGTACFLDGNICYYHYVQTPSHSTQCTDLLRRVVLGEVHAFTTIHVLAEAVHKIMLAEAAATFVLTRAGLANWLQRDPARIKQLTEFRTAADAFGGLNANVLDLSL